MEIRAALPEDSPGVVEVIRAVYDEYSFSWDPAGYHADLYDLQAHYFDHGDLFWVATVDGKILGTVALEFFPKLDGEPGAIALIDGTVRVGGADCSLERLYVHPEGRRLGIGSALTTTAIEAAKAAGRSLMELWSDKRFGDAHRLYGRFGAEVVGDRVCDDPDESPEWGLALRLI